MRGKVLDYIHKNYNKKITLDDLCNIGTINKSYLIKKFSETTSTTPYKYIENYRINKAISYLEDDIKTETISRLVGYDDVKQFYRVFKKITGYSTGRYKYLASNISERNNIKRIYATKQKINEV